ncbi:MAG TPA: YetF domain-containing protein [Pyrinomonadaceae bacterium]|nr:YetF domain-containing protein [Pyrinomonadaceae bacterium]
MDFAVRLLLFVSDSSFERMFTLDDGVSLLEKILRPAIVYLALVIMLRIFGRRELAQLNPLDLVVILSISNTVQNAIIGSDNSVIGGVIGATALLLVNYIFSRLKFSAKPIEKFAEGEPLVLIEHGKKNTEALRRELISDADLEIIAHEHGLENAEEIDKLVLDTNGTFLVYGKDEIRDARFKHEVLRKLAAIEKRMNTLAASPDKA